MQGYLISYKATNPPTRLEPLQGNQSIDGLIVARVLELSLILYNKSSFFSMKDREVSPLKMV